MIVAKVCDKGAVTGGNAARRARVRTKELL